MFKKITSLLLVVLFISSIAYAQDRSGGYARVKSLGNNPFVYDPEGILYNPALASGYGNFLWGDIGENSGASFGDASMEQFMGVDFAINKDLTLGAILTRNDSRSFVPAISSIDPNGIVGLANSMVPGAPFVLLNNNVEILGAYNLSSMTIGLGVSYVSTSDQYKPAAAGGNWTANAHQLGISAGIFTPITSSIKLDGAINLLLPDAKYTPATLAGAPPSNEVSQTIFNVNARAYITLNSQFNLVPIAGFGMTSGTINSGGTSTDMDKNTNFNVGVAIQYKQGNFMFIGGPSFMYTGTTHKAVSGSNPDLKNSITTFPGWNLGAEWQALNWLICRMGYWAQSANITTQTTATPTTLNENTYSTYPTPPAAMTLGIGLRFGDFGLDGYVNADVLRQGLGNIGGGPTLGFISASYAF